MSHGRFPPPPDCGRLRPDRWTEEDDVMSQTMLELRQDLACALRWAARLNLHEGGCNHFALAVPDDDGVVRGNRFLINP